MSVILKDIQDTEQQRVRSLINFISKKNLSLCDITVTPSAFSFFLISFAACADVNK